jgi:hypothetical protein
LEGVEMNLAGLIGVLIPLTALSIPIVALVL